MPQAGTQLKWTQPIVVDKHCIDGVRRCAWVDIPKTSSCAVTSPAGAADMMEALARVDLRVDEMKEVVAACKGYLGFPS